MPARGKSSRIDLPPMLIDAVRNRRVILFIGAGASKEAQNPDGKRPPDADELRDMLAETFFARPIKNRDVMAVAEMAGEISGGKPKVYEEVRKIFDPFEPSDAHKMLPTFKWKMIATTNYDLLIERGYAACNNRLQNLARFVKDDELIEDKLSRTTNPVQYLKLHGCFDHLHDSDIPIILARDQYRNYSQNRKRLFERLEDLAREFPILFIGYRLDDPHIRDLIYSLAGNKRQRWHLVTPDAEQYDIDFYNSKNIGIIKCKFGQFMDALHEKLPPLLRTLAPSDNVSDFPIRRFYGTKLEESDDLKASLSLDLTFVHSGIPTNEQTAKQFYAGYDTGWGAILQRFDVRRRKEEDLLFKALLENERPASTILFLIRGAAGSGKTIALKRTAYEAATSSDALVLWLNDNGALRPNVFEEVFELSGKTIYLFIDQVALRVDRVVRFLRDMRKKSVPLVIIGAERDSDWNTYCAILEAEHHPQFMKLTNLSRSEITGLLDLLDYHDCLGLLKNKSRTEQIKAFEEKDKADRQLLVILHELTLGKPFEEIILDEHRRIFPETAQQLYLDIATMHQFAVKIRAGTISRISGIDFNDYKEKFVSPLKDIVRIDGDGYTEDYYYQTRHSRVATIVFNQVCQSDRDKSKQIIRMIGGIDPGYMTDLRAMEDMTRGRSMVSMFAEAGEARKIYKAATDLAPKQAFILQQWAIFESSHPSGNLLDAEQLADKAHELDERSKSIIHTQAEIARKRASDEESTLLKQSLRRKSRILLDQMPSGDRFAVSSRCKILVDELTDMHEDLSDTPDEYEAELFAEKMKDVEISLSRAQQMHPDDADIIAVEARYWAEINEKGKALKALERALKAGPKGTSTAIKVARRYDEKGRSAEAYRVLRDTIQNQPDDKPAHQAMALHLLHQASYNKDTVENHLRRSFSVGDKNFEERFNLAQFLFVRGSVMDSKQAFSGLDSTAPGDFRQFTPKSDNIFTNKLSRYAGTVEEIRDSFLYIKSSAYPDLLFSHRSASNPDIIDELSYNEEVSFKIRFNRKGPVAVDIRIGRS